MVKSLRKIGWPGLRAVPGIVRLNGLGCLPSVDEPLAELAAYFRTRSVVPDEVLVRLTAAASRWDAIAAACGVTRYEDTIGVVFQPSGTIADTGAGLLFAAAQYATEKLTGGRRYPPLTWCCRGCGQQVTDRAATGRPVHIEFGHAAGCARLAANQAANAGARRERLPGLIVHSENAVGPVQRHWLAERIDDDCPRCGWHGYFHHYIATIDGDWGAAVCGNCYADLHPDITVTVRYFLACWPIDGEPVAVIRQRTRSDYEFPDLGQMMTWQLCWQHTPMLVDDRRGNCIEDITEISRHDAEQIAVSLAARNWPPDAARLPWVVSAYPE